MHPIHYSLIFNLVALALSAYLAVLFAQPLLILVVLLVAQHTMSRFSRMNDDDEDDDNDDDDGPGMGFTAKL